VWNRTSGERIDCILGLAKDFRTDGILLYQTIYRDGYDIQSFYFEKKIKERADLKGGMEYEGKKQGICINCNVRDYPICLLF